MTDVNGVHSIIYHFIISNSLNVCVNKYCTVNYMDNMSDHLPLCMYINLRVNINYSSDYRYCMFKPKWSSENEDFFYSNQGDRIVNRNIKCISVLPFNQITDDELASDFHNEKINTNNNVQDQIDELENMIMIEDRNDGNILSDIDPDLNILYNMNDAINTSSRYYDSYLSTFHFCKTQFSILNANIRGLITNLDNLKFFLDD